MCVIYPIDPAIVNPKVHTVGGVGVTTYGRYAAAEACIGSRKGTSRMGVIPAEKTTTGKSRVHDIGIIVKIRRIDKSTYITSIDGGKGNSPIGGASEVVVNISSILVVGLILVNVTECAVTAGNFSCIVQGIARKEVATIVLSTSKKMI